MKELIKKLKLCWYVLKGYSVMYKIGVDLSKKKGMPLISVSRLERIVMYDCVINGLNDKTFLSIGKIRRNEM